LFIAAIMGLMLLAACNQPGDYPATDNAPTAADPADTSLPATSRAPASAAAAQPTSPAVEVTYFTPTQQEGPYYPPEKPDDRDNDLVNLAGATGDPAGEVLSLSGVVYDANGRPVDGALVEIWQTDSNGIYLHPGDPDTADRDPNFQFYGESLTGSDGVYSFRTILPGRYEPRPRHIHVKIKLGGQELLTTQFYFPGDVSFSGDEANLVVNLAPAEDDAGRPIWVGERDIVLRLER
jgi:protocatechuate 3,4-dioxygenase beta subunit